MRSRAAHAALLVVLTLVLAACASFAGSAFIHLSPPIHKTKIARRDAA